MHPQPSIPFPLFHPIYDNNPRPGSSHSTPGSSFLYLSDQADSDDEDDLPCRDSGYFSMMGKESPIKSALRQPSRADLRHPPVPTNDTPDATQESQKRDGVIKSFLRKKKISMTSPSSVDMDPIQSTPFSLPSPPPSPCDSCVESFEPQDRFVVRRGMKHHPYTRHDAPYMLAYDRVLLDNDKFSEILLRRLNHNGSPSFHDFSHASPKAILDLGCGSGGWAIEAAEFWPSSQVIGFDLLHPVRLLGATEAPQNVQWRQGNFVKYKLPFPKNTFDFVRMANLSLCIPYGRWEHVLSEARRVLTQGGRLELIDDHLYFPYTKNSPQPLDDLHATPLSSFDDYKDGGIEEGRDMEGQDYPDEDDNDDDDDFVSTKSRFSSLVDTEEDFLPQLAYHPATEWNRNVDNSKSLEKLFEDMLRRKFSIHPRPSKFFNRAIDKVFGRYNQCRLHEFNLYLAPPFTQDCDGCSAGSSESQTGTGLKKAGKDFAKWVSSVEWDHLKEKEKKQRIKGDRSSEEILTNLSVVPDMINAKAAGRLGIRPTQPSHTTSTQSPGLILWPATFIPMAPSELEMHACKHLHSLIGCKAALIEFLHDVAREKQLYFDGQMLDDSIWEYESFRRKRFNWPSVCPESRLDSSITTTTPRSNTLRNSSEQPRPRVGSGSMSAPPDPLFPRDRLDFVRSIRVYSATKLDEEIHVP